MHVHKILEIKSDVSADVECHLLCNSCKFFEYSRFLPFKCNLVQEYLRNLDSSTLDVRNDLLTKTIECRSCCKPYNANFSSIRFIGYKILSFPYEEKPVEAHFNCNSCDYKQFAKLSNKNELVRKFLQNVN